MINPGDALPSEKRVLFVEPYGQLGGSQSYLLSLLDGLPRDTVVGVICLQDGPFPDALEKLGYDVHRMPTGPRAMDLVRRVPSLLRVTRSLDPDVIHSNGLKATLLLGLTGKGISIPIVWVKHDFSWDGHLSRLAARFCSRVIGVSAAVTAGFSERTKREKVRTIHNGVEVPAMDRADAHLHLLKALGRTESTRVIAIVGRLHPVKGHDDLIDAGKLLRERHPNVHIAVVGADDPSTGDYSARLRQRVRQEHLGDLVTFLGFREDALRLTAGADVLAIPSGGHGRTEAREAFPYSALEAMAVGTPVVAYDGGGVTEALGDCGLLVPSGSIQELSSALERALLDEELQKRLERCGPERVRDLFGLRRMIEATMQVYEDAAMGRSRRSHD